MKNRRGEFPPSYEFLMHVLFHPSTTITAHLFPADYDTFFWTLMRPLLPPIPRKMCSAMTSQASFSIFSSGTARRQGPSSLAGIELCTSPPPLLFFSSSESPSQCRPFPPKYGGTPFPPRHRPFFLLKRRSSLAKKIFYLRVLSSNSTPFFPPK